MMARRAAMAASCAAMFLLASGCARSTNAILPGDDAAIAPSWKGKPAVVEGITLQGKQFSTTQWRGKVILVDFWATWCVPCRAELPHTKQMYAKLHDKGFEIVGVSSDESAEDLERFLSANPQMTWPQLFDRENPGDHPLGDTFEIDGYPTVLLIDRRGVLRFGGAKVDEGMVRRLLAERAE